MTLDLGEHRVGGPVEQLNGCDMRLEIPVSYKSLEGFFIAHQRLRRALIEISIEVTNAVAAIEWTANDVIQAEPAFAVPDRIYKIRVGIL
ncbi:hypothetical protein D3C71_1941820 [compost metagenome]